MHPHGRGYGKPVGKLFGRRRKQIAVAAILLHIWLGLRVVLTQRAGMITLLNRTLHTVPLGCRCIRVVMSAVARRHRVLGVKPK